MKPLKGVTCIIQTRKGPRENWPVYDQLGNWALTPPPNKRRLPIRNPEFMSVTHLPTGMRTTTTVRIDHPSPGMILRRYESMFGSARTVSGIMRKYAQLSPRDKKWIAKI